MKQTTRRRTGKLILAAVLIIAGLLLCMNTFFAYRYSCDWNLGVVMPAFIGFGCFAWALKLIMLKEPILKDERLRTVVIGVFIACVLIFVFVEVLIIIDPFIHSSELAGEVDTVIVLGCGIWPDGAPTLSLVSRLDKAVEYYERDPNVNIIVSGGQGPNEPFPEAVAMKDYLLVHDIPAEKIIIEDKSTSTRENFEYSGKLLNMPENGRKKIVFVTNDFHIFRSRILADRFGFEAYGIAAPTPSVILLNSYLREFFAFIKTMLVDY